MKTQFLIYKQWRQRLTRHQVILIAGLGLVFLLWAAHYLYQSIGKVNTSPDRMIRVQVVKVKVAPMPDTIQTIGSLVPEKEIKIRAVMPGKVQSLEVDSGSWVNMGTPLIKIIGGPEVRAPFDGYLSDWLVKPGEYVQAGTEMVDLVNTDTLKLVYRIPEQFAAKLDNQQEVEIFVKAYPEKTFKGVVRFIAPVVDKKTSTILIKAEVENPNQDLWPGMSAHVNHLFRRNPDALVIPESALILTMEGYEVLTIKEGVLVKKAVQIGSRSEGRAEVKTGLENGEEVLLVRTFATKEGVKVEQEEWKGDW
jgi:multidrug efflux pump subunit AcrA (membrane-fusion protein)